MQALVLGRPGLERSRARELLHDAGFDVEECHDRDWGCVGMDGDCPLDVLTVDVAVAVSEPGDRFDAQGIACLHRARVPIVTIGATAHDPVLGYATTNVAFVEPSIIPIIREAAADASGHRRAVEYSLAARVAAGETISTSVRRRGGQIDVDLTGNISGARAAALADAARAAIREYDPHASAIDVSVLPTVTDERD